MFPSLVFPLVAVGGCNGISNDPWFALPCRRDMLRFPVVMKSMYVYISVHNMLTSICYISRPASLLPLHLIFFIPSPLHWYPHSSDSFYMPSIILSVLFYC